MNNNVTYYIVLLMNIVWNKDLVIPHKIVLIATILHGSN